MDYIREAVEYLKSYEDWEESIENLTNQIIVREMDLNCIKEVDYSGMPHGGSVSPDDKMVNCLFSIQVLKKNRQITKKKLEVIDKTLNNMPELERKVLQLWFIEKHKIHVMEDKTGYSKSQLYDIKNKAIRRFSKKLFGIEIAI